MTYFGLLNGSVIIGGAIEYAVKTKVSKTLYKIRGFQRGGGGKDIFELKELSDVQQQP